MYRRTFENTTFTTWAPEIDRIKMSHPQGRQGEAPSGSGSHRGLRQRDKFKPLWVEIQYRGGPEASWLVKARGQTYRFPGHMCLHDCLAEVAF